MSGFDLTQAEREKLRIYQAERVVVGHCPSCSRVVVLLNDREVWAPAICGCGWAGGSTDLLNHIRHERGGIVFPDTVIRWKRRELWRSPEDRMADAELAAQGRAEGDEF